MVPRPRLGTGGLLVWAVAILAAFGMAWVDLQHMAERGAFEGSEDGGPARAGIAPAVQPIEVISDAPSRDAGVEVADAGLP